MRTDTDPLAVWCAGSEWCPITTTATLIGKKWHPVVIHRLLENGPLGFNALKTEVDGISGKVQSDVLEDLEVDILLRVNAEESHGTTPLGWEFQVCRLPSQHTVGIGE